MAGFPPNPDDSALWLPSGSFFNEVPSRLCSHRLDDLAQHFAALTLLNQHQNLSKEALKVSPNVQVTHASLSFKVLVRSLHGCFNLVFLRLFFPGFQRLRPPVQYGLASPLSQSQGRFTLSNGLEDGRGVYGCKTGSYLGGGGGGGSQLFYEYQLLKPTKPRVHNTKPET